MKMVKKFFFGLLIAAPLLMVPKQSKANIITEILHAIFGNSDKKDKKTDSPPPPSVPLDGGLLLLTAAGAILGVRMLNSKVEEGEVCPA
jgi:hypothetical protein